MTMWASVLQARSNCRHRPPICSAIRTSTASSSTGNDPPENGSAYAVWNATDGHGNPARVSLTANLAGDSMSVSQCVDTALTAIDLTGFSKVQYATPGQTLRLTLLTYPAAGCDGGGYTSLVEALPELQPDGWYVHRLLNAPLPAWLPISLRSMPSPMTCSSARLAARRSPTGSSRTDSSRNLSMQGAHVHARDAGGSPARG